MTVEKILQYHERTKHQPGRFARSPGTMDWENQPDPFRAYQGAHRLPLDRDAGENGPGLAELLARGGVQPASLDRSFVSRLLYTSLALSAWKAHGGSRWSLRCNPSSGNLHPTEGWLICSQVPGLCDSPGVHHYAPLQHALERRLELSEQQWRRLSAGLPERTVLVGLTSLFWREAWKYGERAFRYCQHDVGHAAAGVAYAAAALGWRAAPLGAVADGELSRLLGIQGQQGPEAEHPDLLICLWPEDADAPDPAWRPDPALLEELGQAPFAGEPGRLGREYLAWPAIDGAAAAAVYPGGEPAAVLPPPGAGESAQPGAGEATAAELFRRRRSAVSMDPTGTMPADAFFHLAGRLLPHRDAVPFTPLPEAPATHLMLMVHRVEGVSPGLYCLTRASGARQRLRPRLRPEYLWEPAPGAPTDLPLWLLAEGDISDLAGAVSCQQAIAADGVFMASMLSEVGACLGKERPWAYRRLFWEAGALGQALYIEAEAAGLRGCGIGCYLDDVMHRFLGLQEDGLQVLYHFTVGRAVDDPRLQTLGAYHHLDDA